MLFLFPKEAGFGSATWSNVTSVAIERKAEKSFLEFADGGSHVVLADVPEQRVSVTVIQELLSDDMDEPSPGEQGLLSFETAPNASGAGRKRVSMTAVVLGVDYQVSRKAGSVRRVDLVAVSADGVADPVGVVDV